jgi:hypothetical protein
MPEARNQPLLSHHASLIRRQQPILLIKTLFSAPVEVQVRTPLSGRLQALEKPLVKEIPEGAPGVKNRFLKTFVEAAVMVEPCFHSPGK